MEGASRSFGVWGSLGLYELTPIVLGGGQVGTLENTVLASDPVQSFGSCKVSGRGELTTIGNAAHLRSLDECLPIGARLPLRPDMHASGSGLRELRISHLTLYAHLAETGRP